MGGQQFNGKGKMRQAVRHDATARALRTLQSEPPPERLEVGGRRPGHTHTTADAACSYWLRAIKILWPGEQVSPNVLAERLSSLSFLPILAA